MKKVAFLLSFCAVATSFAQQDGLPANPEPGKCYVKCVSHDEFKTVTETVLITPEYKVLKRIPETYKWVEEKVLVKEASKKLIYVPATYKTVQVPYVKKQAGETITITPASFGNSSKEIEVSPKSVGWEYTTYTECASPNPEDCQVLCFKETPSESINVPIKTLSNDASSLKRGTNPQEATYSKKVIDKEAYMKEVAIPAQYATIKKQVVNSPARVEEKTIPAVYKDVQRQELVKKGGVSTWAAIDCGLVVPNELDILWGLNSAQLNNSSKNKIDNVLLKLLTDKPTISIELSSHTDSRGSGEFNRALSQRRADAIKSYLISKGVSASRLISKGYGETRLKNNCGNGSSCSESQHQVNRRTEYKVLGN